jgi:hypothetical protein
MTIIHVAQDAIRKNAKHGTDDPAIIVRENSRKSARHHQVELRDEAGRLLGTFKYQPHEPLRCGARVWLELAEGVSAHACV